MRRAPASPEKRDSCGLVFFSDALFCARSNSAHKAPFEQRPFRGTVRPRWALLGPPESKRMNKEPAQGGPAFRDRPLWPSSGGPVRRPLSRVGRMSSVLGPNVDRDFGTTLARQTRILGHAANTPRVPVCAASEHCPTAPEGRLVGTGPSKRVRVARLSDAPASKSARRSNNVFWRASGGSRKTAAVSGLRAAVFRATAVFRVASKGEGPSKAAECTRSSTFPSDPPSRRDGRRPTAPFRMGSFAGGLSEGRPVTGALLQRRRK